MLMQHLKINYFKNNKLYAVVAIAMASLYGCGGGAGGSVTTVHVPAMATTASAANPSFFLFMMAPGELREILDAGRRVLLQKGGQLTSGTIVPILGTINKCSVRSWSVVGIISLCRMRKRYAQAGRQGRTRR